MQVEGLYPGITLEQVQSHCSFEIRAAATLEATARPSDEQLRLLRQVIDPHGVYVGAGKP
jgi:glutaconate CoA-transferase subunit B